MTKQGSLHYTPEHCLVNGGFPLFWVGKSHVSNGCNMYLLRSPAKLPLSPLHPAPIWARPSWRAEPRRRIPPGRSPGRLSFLQGHGQATLFGDTIWRQAHKLILYKHAHNHEYTFYTLHYITLHYITSHHITSHYIHAYIYIQKEAYMFFETRHIDRGLHKLMPTNL